MPRASLFVLVFEHRFEGFDRLADRHVVAYGQPGQSIVVEGGFRLFGVVSRAIV